MFHVEIDTTRNLLVLIFTKQVSTTQARHCRVEVEAALSKLALGFRLLTDLSNLEKMDYACAVEISKMMDSCREKGVAEVVRVIPDSKKDIGFKVMSFFHYGHAVPIVTCETLKKAQMKLGIVPILNTK